jgi:predicted metal-binding membrane protein
MAGGKLVVAAASAIDTAGIATRAQRAVLLVSAAAVTLAAWLWMLHSSAPHQHAHHALMPASRNQLRDFRSFASAVVMWQAMMVAMMTPTVVRWLFTFAALTGRDRGAQHTFGSVASFGAGYFTVWLGYSVLAAMLQTALEHAGFLQMGGRLPSTAGGAVLIAAGLLYFTPFSRACLSHCRNPLTYFLARWDRGPGGGFGIGLTHGAYCVGCCWAVMVTGFAMGVMNMLWMAFLTVLMCVEKLAPHGDRIGAAAAVAMMVWGIALLF